MTSTIKPGMYVKKPIPVRCDQWWRNGDHPLDRVGEQELDEVALFEQHPELIHDDGTVGPVPDDAPTYTRVEGAVVRYYRSPDVPGESVCAQCGYTMHVHGFIETMEGGMRVCPGDVIITGVAGERYPCKPGIFAATYQLVSAVDAALLANLDGQWANTEGFGDGAE